MKYRLTYILLLLSTFLAAQQRITPPKMFVGGQIGVMASMVNFTPKVEQTALNPFLGANAGAMFRYVGHHFWGLQVELNWLQKGWKEKETGYTRELNYLEVPLLTHFYFGKQVNGFINAGPQIGYCIYDKGRHLPDESAEQYMSLDHRFDWGIAAGLGMYVNSVAGVWQIEARFNYSFQNIFADHKSDYFSSSVPYNLSLNFSYLWQVKGERWQKKAKKTAIHKETKTAEEKTSKKKHHNESTEVKSGLLYDPATSQNTNIKENEKTHP